MLSPDLLREIVELSQETSGTSRPDLLRAALRELLDDRERLLSQIAELELFIKTGEEEPLKPWRPCAR